MCPAVRLMLLLPHTLLFGAHSFMMRVVAPSKPLPSFHSALALVVLLHSPPHVLL